MTLAANVVPVSEASQFGCIKTDATGRIIEFLEKPAVPPEIPDKPGYSYVSMGNYIFERNVLEEALLDDAQQPTSHDFGRDIIPNLIALLLLSGKVAQLLKEYNEGKPFDRNRLL